MLAATIAITTDATRTAEGLAHEALRAADLQLPRGAARVALSGTDQRIVAALAVHLINQGHQVVLAPFSPAEGEDRWPLHAGHRIHATDGGLHHLPAPRGDGVCGDWQVAMYSSGSTGTARAYGFTRQQLDTVARWYTSIYRVTATSAVVTSLPVCYNFTFVAGLYLAAVTGAQLHLSATPQVTLSDAARLAGAADRVVVLANPVLLQLADHTVRLPDNVVVDSGGAPLSAPSIAFLRQIVGDVREGYGLTETASLTHFDAEGTVDSLGTVGVPMAEVRCWTTMIDGRPRLELDSPAVGVELGADGTAGTPRRRLLTGDLASIDHLGRLRLLGRADDWPIEGMWPRDTLDLIGTRIGVRCALVRHPTAEQVQIRVLGDITPGLAAALRTSVGRELRLPPTRISVEGVTGSLLHSRKLPRVARPDSSR
jgi:hypothetical protein